MSGYVLSARARRDLQDIWRFSAERWSTVRADEYVAEITNALQQLSDGRRTPQTVNLAGRRYSRILIGSHVIFCRPRVRGQLAVVRILHQSMNAVWRLR